MMPSHRRHVQHARELGIDPEVARKVARFLDQQRPHKSLHNPTGVAVALLLYGSEGAKAAADHILHDLAHEHMPKTLRILEEWLPRMVK